MEQESPVEHVRYNLSSRESAEFYAEEANRYEHYIYRHTHEGHVMHVEIIIIFFITVIGIQVILIEWKRRHRKSYQLTTLFGIWLTPLIISWNNSFWRFIFLSLVFTAITAFIVSKALKSPVEKTTPRIVYKWFYFVYKTSYFFGLLGDFLMFAIVTDLTSMVGVDSETVMDIAIMYLFYSLYFGVMGQDIAEISSDKMATTISYYSTELLPLKQKDACAICCNSLSAMEGAKSESIFRLSCDHVFHEFCIRGWCIIGKKQTCPYCKEKVDLKRMFPSPWERQHLLYTRLLDCIRWFIAWLPFIFCILRGINYILHLE